MDYGNIKMSRMLQIFSEMGYMNESNKPIVLYGIQRIKNLLMDFMISVICGWFMGNVLIGIMFEAAFIPLRIYAGGYHAHNRKICIMISWGSIIVCIAVISYIPIVLCAQHILIALSGLYIVFYAPVESSNKPLNRSEKNVFRIRSIRIVITEVVVYGLFSVSDILLYSKTISIAVFLVAIGILKEKI